MKSLIVAVLLGVLPSTTTEVNHVGNGSTTIFAFTFKTITSSHVEVRVDDVVQVTGFTTALNANQDSAPGGSVTFSVAPVSLAAINIRRNTPKVQEMTLSPYSAFPAKTVEKSGFDRLTMYSQELQTLRNNDLTAQDARDDAQDATSSTLLIATPTTIGGIKGNGATTLCSAGSVMRGWAEGDGAMSCTTDSLPVVQFHGSSGPQTPNPADGTTGLTWNPLPFTNTRNATWGCAQPAGWNTAVITVSGAMPDPATLGSLVPVGYVDSDDTSRARWITVQSASGTNQSGNVRRGVSSVLRGTGSGRGGFYWWGAFSILSSLSTQRVFFGLQESVAIITATIEPSTQSNTAYFGCDSTEANLHFCRNTGGPATCQDLGAGFPCHTAGAYYDVAIWAVPSVTEIGWYVRNLGTGAADGGVVTTDLPAASTPLAWQLWINTAGTNNIATMNFGGACEIGRP
jgi:hypothetical protein